MTSEQIEALANRIKARRAVLGFKQAQLARRVGLAPGSYTRIENAFHKPSLDTLIKIAEILGLSLDYLVFGSEPQKNSQSTITADTILAIADPDMLAHTRDILTAIIRAKTDT